MKLLILAAGLGSRFGGPKQLAAVGPDGESLPEYNIFDARRAGFSGIVLLIRRDMERGCEKQVWSPGSHPGCR